jgi:hypothetical protein
MRVSVALQHPSRIRQTAAAGLWAPISDRCGLEIYLDIPRALVQAIIFVKFPEFSALSVTKRGAK